MPADGYQFCSQCNCLVHNDNVSGTLGTCANGQSHNVDGSWNYTLFGSDDVVPGQPSWAWCSQCSQVVFAGPNAPSWAGRCPAGGEHRLGGNLTVPTLAQNQWSWCSLCQSLWFSGSAGQVPGGGACPGNPNPPGMSPRNGPHSLAGSEDYWLLAE